MSSLTLDPDLRQALEDVAKKSPEGGIFAGLGANGIKGSFQLPDQSISVARAGLSTAERHILKSHRSELAWVLEEAFLVSYLPTLKGDVDAEFQGADFQAGLSSLEQLGANARRTQESSDPLSFRYRTGFFISKIARAERIANHKERLSLLVAAMRLRDSSFARYYYAHSSLKAGALEVAVKSVSGILASGETRMEAYAHSLCREKLQLQGRFRESIPHGILASDLALHSDNEWLALSEAALLLHEATRRNMPVKEVGIGTLDIPPDSILVRAEARVGQMLAIKSISKEEANRTLFAYQSAMQ
jgi:hypothetical protein